MLPHDPNYRRLKVGGRGLLSAVTYWLGPDHLLVVEVVGYVERYRRFHYEDMQALIMRRTEIADVLRRISIGLVALLAALGFSFVAGRAGVVWGTADTVVTVLLGGLLGGALLGFVVNLLRGPTCICHLVTAVKTHELPRLVRWRNAQKALEALRPLVESAQKGAQPQPSAARSETAVPFGAPAGSSGSSGSVRASDPGATGSMSAETPAPVPPPHA
jgi:hypothetical protein